MVQLAFHCTPYVVEPLGMDVVAVRTVVGVHMTPQRSLCVAAGGVW